MKYLMVLNMWKLKYFVFVNDAFIEFKVRMGKFVNASFLEFFTFKLDMFYEIFEK